MISASSLQRLDVCPASGALPQVRAESAAMRRGSIVHAYLDRCADGNRDAALAEVPDEHRDYCAAIDLTRLPFDVTAPHVVTEPAYTYDVATGEATLIGRRIGRQYGQLAATEIPGSVDVVVHGEAEVGAWDYKVGHGIELLAPPPARNHQLKTYGLMSARQRQVDLAGIGRIRIDDDARVWVDEPHRMDVFDLADHAEDLARIHHRVQRAREDVLTGRPPSVTQSAWCSYCPAFASCPAQAQLVRQMAVAPDDLERFVADALTPDLAARAWERVRLAEKVVERVRKAVEDYARRTPISLGDGRVLALTTTTRESIDGDLASALLAEEYGDHIAESAVRRTITKAALKDALRTVAQRSGEPLARVERHALALLRERGAVTETTTETVKERRA